MVLTGAYIAYDQWRSIEAAYTMYKISRLYGRFNDKYRERMLEITNRRFGGGNDTATDNNDGNSVPSIDKSDNTMTAEEREAQVMEDDAFMDFYALERRKVHQEAADLLLHLCRTNKGAYVKAGQYLASLSYILPREYTETLSVLIDRAPTHTYEETVQIFREEFGLDPTEVFSSFDPEPIASASIAQVHVARLKDTNEKVAVKIQHPNLHRIFQADLRAMEWIMFAYKLKNKFSLDWLLPEFERVLLSELDFMNEAKNCERLRDMFSDTNSITVPELHWDKVTRRVLVMEFIEGCKVNDREQMAKMGISPQLVAQLLLNSFSRQTFEYGFIHSDLHPGNLFVRYNEQLRTPQLVYLDHGCYEELSEKTRLDYASLWKSIVFRDHEDMRHFTQELGIDSEFYILFAMFLSAANVLDSNRNAMLDNRRQKSMSKAEWKHVVKRLREKYLVNGRSTLDDIIEDMIDQNSTNRSLVLLLRANAQLRNLIFEMDASVNRFGTMAQYCIRAVSSKMRLHNKIVENGGHTIVIPVRREKKRTMLELLSMHSELLQLKFRLLMLDMLVWLSQKLSLTAWFNL